MIAFFRSFCKIIIRFLLFSFYGYLCMFDQPVKFCFKQIPKL